jgi:hypothetical protein
MSRSKAGGRKERSMDTVNRLLYAALGIVGCVAGFEFGHPSLVSLTDRPSGKVAHVRPGDASVARCVFVLPQRTRAKGRVIDQLANGRMGLFEAAAWFRWLNENPPDCLGEPIKGWPGASPEEKLCRQVISAVRIVNRRVGADSQANELAERLEMELADALARKGGVVLPSLAGETPGE